ncbi:MAG: helix-turn-helix transcriptional regulator [Candidatus Omnitrophica bacterium]|nr:helix-turn-helix transcriptional regulator [Candidatus Omnitrophota bacterium]
MGKEILIKFGRRIRQERLKIGMSQEKTAELADLHRNYIGLIERAEKNVTLLNVEKIAKALNTTPSKLLK